MSSVPRVLHVVGDTETPALPGRVPGLEVQRCILPTEGSRSVPDRRGDAVDVVVLEPGDRGLRDLPAVARDVAPSPVVVLHAGRVTADLLDEAIRIGAADVVPVDDVDLLVRTVRREHHRAAAERCPPATDPMEQQLSQARLIAMFDNQLDAVAFADDDARIIQGNPALAALTGMAQEQLAGIDLRTLYEPYEKTVDPFDQAWRSLREEGRLQGEYEAREPGGRVLRLEVRAVADVLPGMHLVAVREVTERSRMELALRASERRFRTLAEYSAEGIFVQRVRPTNRFEYVNPAMARTIGYSLDELYADPELLRSGINEEDRARMWASLDGGAIEAGAVEVDFRRRDGQTLRLRLRGNGIRDDSGEIVAVHAVATDVTSQYRERQALREAVEQQRQLNDLKTGFVQAVSHELRTPLTSIVGFVELLLRRDLDPGERRRYLERISAGAAKLDRLIGDVLDLDRLERPETLIDRDEVDLAELATRVVEETTTTDHHLHLDLWPAATIGDVALLERVVDNLVRNALKHTPADATVWVRTRSPATIIVEDDGPGVPLELHRRIFDPFQQGPDQLDRHSPGAGIGLSLSQRIVRLHRGEITLTDRPGGGARFIVELPAVPT